MPTPVLVNGDVLKVRFLGGDTDVGDEENSQWFAYETGLVPIPGGVTMAAGLQALAAAWASLWTAFQSTSFSWRGARMNIAAGFAPLGGSKYRVVSSFQWSETIAPTPGLVAGQILPATNAFSIRKVFALPGRGSQGHCRVPGVPVSAILDNQVTGTIINAINLALTNTNMVFPLVAGPNTDQVRWGVIRGSHVNAFPLAAPVLHFADALSAHVLANVGTQISRKLARHRS